MKAPMSKRLREIMRDPQKSQAIYEEISRLSVSGERISKNPVVAMGSHKYKVQLITVGLPGKN